MRKLALLITLAITVSGLTGCGMRAPESPAAGDTSSGDSGSADPIVIHTEAPEAKAQTEAQTETAAQEETAGASQAETAAAQTEAPETQPPASAAAAVDAAGSWMQNTATGSRYFTADITGSSITVYLNSIDTGESSVYWTGSFDAASLEENSVYTSTNDHDSTDSLPSASHADTKDFTFTGGALHFKYSKGITQDISLVKDGSSVPQQNASQEAPAGSEDTAEAADAPAEDASSQETVPEADINEEGYTKTAIDNVNVRTGMSTDSEIIGSLSEGDTVTVYSEQDGWAEIVYEGTTAYVSAQYLS